MKCPKCNSENTQRQRIVFESGTYEGSSEVNININNIRGYGTSINENKSILAEKCSPPEKAGPTGLSTLFFCGIILSFIIHNERLYHISLLALFIRLLWVLFIKAPNDRKEYRRKKSIYERLWICHRCGHTWEEEINPLDMF